VSTWSGAERGPGIAKKSHHLTSEVEFELKITVLRLGSFVLLERLEALSLPFVLGGEQFTETTYKLVDALYACGDVAFRDWKRAGQRW
jgi:hypothetical protein